MASEEALPDDFLRELGRVVADWNDLELALNLLLNYLAGSRILDYRGMIVFAHMAFPQKMFAFGALLKATRSFADAYRHHDFPKLRKQIEEAANIRNSLMHSQFTAADGKVHARSIHARNELGIKDRAFTAQQVGEDADRIARTTNAIQKLLSEIDPNWMEEPQVGQ